MIHKREKLPYKKRKEEKKCIFRWKSHPKLSRVNDRKFTPRCLGVKFLKFKIKKKALKVGAAGRI